jgi:hypothetical protein
MRIAYSEAMDRFSAYIAGFFGGDIYGIARGDKIGDPALPAARQTSWHQQEEHGCPGRGEITGP